MVRHAEDAAIGHAAEEVIGFGEPVGVDGVAVVHALVGEAGVLVWAISGRAGSGDDELGAGHGGGVADAVDVSALEGG